MAKTAKNTTVLQAADLNDFGVLLKSKRFTVQLN